MSRAKGSKNRSTLVRELKARGAAEQDLATVPHTELEQRLVQAVAAEPPPPVVVERTVVDPELAKGIIAEAREKFDEMVDYYAPGKVDARGRPFEIPERVHEHLRRAFMAPDSEAVRHIAKRAIDKLFLHLMYEWGQNHITGPRTAENIKRRAADADSWAERLEGEGRYEESDRQRARAVAIRSEAVLTTPFRLWVV